MWVVISGKYVKCEHAFHLLLRCLYSKTCEYWARPAGWHNSQIIALRLSPLKQSCTATAAAAAAADKSPFLPNILETLLMVALLPSTPVSFVDFLPWTAVARVEFGLPNDDVPSIKRRSIPPQQERQQWHQLRQLQQLQQSQQSNGQRHQQQPQQQQLHQQQHQRH